MKIEDLKVDDLIMVKDEQEDRWIERYFSHIENDGKVVCFLNGKTSKEIIKTTPWKYWKPIEDSKLTFKEHKEAKSIKVTPCEMARLEHFNIDEECENPKPNLDGSKNNFYNIPNWVNDLDDLSEYLELDPYEFNILKTLWIHKGNRHDGTNEQRELNKRLHYANKSLDKFKRRNNDRSIKQRNKASRSSR